MKKLALVAVAVVATLVAFVAVVAVAAFPVVFWLPAVFTPGKLMLAEPLNDTPPMVRAVCRVVAVAALPDVELDVAALPEIEIAYVPAARLFTVPLRVMLPLVVTVPDKLKPEAVPVPDTDVTVPVVELVPAPMAVRKDAASKDETVLFALNLGNVIAEGFVIVKRFPPSVVAPRFVLAAAAVVAPVPPFATATVPVTFAAVPVVF
jgi:hypothetical protein